MRVPPSVPAAHMVVPRRSAWQCPACVGRTGAGRSRKEGHCKPVLAGPPLVRSPRMGDNGPMARPAGANAPVLVAVDDHPGLLRDVERELRHRYATDYRICCLSSTDEALATLQNLAAAGEQVAVVLAGEVLAGAPRHGTARGGAAALLARPPRAAHRLGSYRRRADRRRHLRGDRTRAHGSLPGAAGTATGRAVPPGDVEL